MAKVQKTDLAYIAGLLDGEGTISIGKIRTKRKGIVIPNWYQYQLRVTISNSHLPVLKWIIRTVGGTYYTQVNHASKRAVANGQRYFMPCYRWNLTGGYKPIEKFLLAVIPYMQIKKPQALLALQFTRIFETENVQKRDETWQQMRLLNRGSRPETNTWHSSQKELKIESDLTGDSKSEPAVTQDS